MRYIDNTLFDDTVAILFQIILKKESPDDLPVTFQGSFFTEEELAASTPIEVLVDGLETALHMHLYEDEDPTLLKKQLLEAARQLVDVYRERGEESDLYSAMSMISLAGDFRRNYVFKFDRKGNKTTIEAEVGETIRNTIANKLTPSNYGNCGGDCICGSCQIHIADGDFDKFEPINEEEQGTLESKAINAIKNSRLGCQIELKKEHNNIAVTIAPE